MDKAVIEEEELKQVIIIKSVVDEAAIEEETVNQRVQIVEVLDQHIRTGVNMTQGCQLSQDTFVLGTSVKVLDLISVPTVTTAKATFKNPSDVVFINEGAMTKEDDGVYCYVWESAEGDPAGIYTVIIELMYDGKPSVAKKTFTMVAQ